MQRILIIDDDKDMGLVLSKFLIKNNYETSIAHTGKDGLKVLQNSRFDLILCDYKLPDLTGTKLLQKIKAIYPDSVVIVISGYSEIKTVIEAFRFGATDYIMKPLYPEELLATIKEACIKNRAKSHSENGQHWTAEKKQGDEDRVVIGKSPQSQVVMDHINLIAPSDLSVLITGETGTGKEFIAQLIHRLSNRADSPIVAIDCGALHGDLAGSELFGHTKGSFTGAVADKVGSFECAQRGTIFLDEVGNLSYEDQTKLLRVLQERKIKRIGAINDIAIDVRIIAATNDNLMQSTKEGRFREDLYHRLNEFKIQLSPLRERKEDILFFAQIFLQKACLVMNKNVVAFTMEAKERLLNYPWYGNLRELNNVIRRAVLLSSSNEVSIESLPNEVLQTKPDDFQPSIHESSVGLLKSVAHASERNKIIETLIKANYNKSKASQLLNIDRKTLYNKLRLYNIPG